MAAYIHAPDKGEGREALKYTLGLLLILAIGKPIANVIPFGPDILFTVIVYYQIQIPLNMLDKYQLHNKTFGLHAHGVLGTWAQKLYQLFGGKNTPNENRLLSFLSWHGRDAVLEKDGVQAELKQLGLTMLITFIPFLIGYHFWAGVSFRPTDIFPFVTDIRFSVPDLPTVCPPEKGLVMTILLNILVVAVPEELFYRGYVETTLLKKYPLKRWLIVPMGRVVWISATLFALGHFLGEWNPARLGPFFPAFVFSMLTRRTGSIAGAVTYHALSNILSATLFASYTGQCGGWIY